MSGTREPGAIFVGQCRRAGTVRERAESVQSKSMKEGAANCARIYRSCGGDRDGEQHGAEVPSRHVDRYDCVALTTRESGLNTPRRSIAAHPALHKHTLNIIRTRCNIVLH